MDPVTIKVTVASTREDVFGYLVDIANYAQFLDHCFVDWHLTRERSSGRGAGARFRLAIPGNRYSWGDLTLVELESPYRITAYGRMGKNNRTKLLNSFRIVEATSGVVHIEWIFETEPATLADRIMESFGLRLWMRFKLRKAAKRLVAILEGKTSTKVCGERIVVAGC